MAYNRNTKAYKEWRLKVLTRDSFKCKVCRKDTWLHVHHLIPVRKSRKLAVTVSNGIVLCKDCHRTIYLRELAFVPLFRKLIDGIELGKLDKTMLEIIRKNRKVKLYRGIKGRNLNKKKSKGNVLRAAHKCCSLLLL